MGTALVVVDVQNEYVTGALPISHPPVEQSLAQVAVAMDATSGARVPVVVVRHSEPAESGVFVPGSEGWQLHDVVTSRPHDALFEKSLPGSFTGTGLEGWLAERGVDTVVIAGYLTHMCVDTTARQATHRGLRPVVLSDATGDVDLADDLPASLVHRVELAVLGDGLAEVMTTDEFVASISAPSP